MDMKELSDLIATRNYVLLAIDNFSIDKETSRYMSDLRVILDKKIIDLLKGDEFKSYVGYEKLAEVKREMAETNNEVFQKARQKLNTERGFK